MNKIFILSVFYIIYFNNVLFSQKLEFTQIKPVEEGYTVYFHVTGIKDDIHAQEILEDLLKDNNIFRGRHFISIEGKHRYQLYINEFVTAEYVRQILKAHDTDFDFSTVAIDGVIPNKTPKINANENIESTRIKVNAPGFPEYKSTGNKIEDDERYRFEKEKWINENPSEYERLLKEMEKNNNK